MDDMILALKGDREAAKRLTDAGVLLPCPWCGRAPDVEYDTMELFEWTVICPECGVYHSCCDTEEQARLSWNTRAAIGAGNEH